MSNDKVGLTGADDKGIRNFGPKLPFPTGLDLDLAKYGVKVARAVFSGSYLITS
jgi:hypothetical protein